MYSVGKVKPGFEGVDGNALVVDGAELGGSAIDGDVGGFVERAEEAGRAVGGGGELVEVVGLAHAETAAAVALAEEVPDPVIGVAAGLEDRFGRVLEVGAEKLVGGIVLVVPGVGGGAVAIALPTADEPVGAIAVGMGGDGAGVGADKAERVEAVVLVGALVAQLRFHTVGKGDFFESVGFGDIVKVEGAEGYLLVRLITFHLPKISGHFVFISTTSASFSQRTRSSITKVNFALHSLH